jgi:hypothetical protein
VVLDISVHQGESEYSAMKSQFDDFCRKDHYLDQKLQNGLYGVFEYFDKEFGALVEISPSLKSLPSNVVHFRLCENEGNSEGDVSSKVFTLSKVNIAMSSSLYLLEQACKGWQGNRKRQLEKEKIFRCGLANHG